MSTAREAIAWLGRPSLRRRLALLSALAVVVAIAAASALAYYTMAEALRSQVDRALATNPLTVANGAGTSLSARRPTGTSGVSTPSRCAAAPLTSRLASRW